MADRIDYEALQLGYSDNSAEKNIACAARSALRSLLLIGDINDEVYGANILKVLRAAMVAALASNTSTVEIAVKKVDPDSLADLTAQSVIAAAEAGRTVESRNGDGAAGHSASQVAKSCCAAARAAALVTFGRYAEEAATSAASAFGSRIHGSDDTSAQQAIILAAAKDMEAETPQIMFATPLWEENKIPESARKGLDRFLALWEGNPPVWQFWKDFYLGWFEGHPLDLELQNRIAQIPTINWNQGPEQIAVEIARVETALQISRQIEVLTGDLKSMVENRHGIGGNSLPAEVGFDGLEITDEQVDDVLTPLDDLDNEVQAPTPNKTKIAQLRGILKEKIEVFFAEIRKRISQHIDGAVAVAARDFTNKVWNKFLEVLAALADFISLL